MDEYKNTGAVYEPDFPAAEKPEKTEYTCDVLVVGCGFAGLNAAWAAKMEGADVLVVDKGMPGYSGMSPFASSHQWFDEEMGDDLEAFVREMVIANEYMANLDWYRTWARYSKETYLRLKEWGILKQYPTGKETGHHTDGDWRHDDLRGYMEQNAGNDRRSCWTRTLKRYGIPFVPHTMLYDVIEQDGRAAGAVGFHVPSAEIITFHAKTVVLCMGGGSIKPSGFPTGCDTFDSDWIGYRHGLPIVGKEFDDFHFTTSYAPGNVLSNNGWQYAENIWLCGGDITKKNLEMRAKRISNSLITPRLDAALEGLPAYARSQVISPNGRGKSLSGNPSDPRTGKGTSPAPKGDAYGAAPGMHLHLGCGIWCGIDDLEGKTRLDGLWVAGDGCNGSCVSGSSYMNSTGFTSNFCSVQGYLAGKAAGKSALVRKQTVIAETVLQQYREEILDPRNREKGFSPAWARDQLAALMSPYWVSVVKTEQSLQSTLQLVLQLRDQVMPRLAARSPHELRMCHEMEHKILCAEMKLRASMERKESRGYHYRSDYPYRDDDYLCYLTITKDGDRMRFDRVSIKDEWKGNTDLPYAERYQYFRFPGEAAAKGLPEEPPAQMPWAGGSAKGPAPAEGNRQEGGK